MGIPVFDAHCDTIFRVARSGGRLRQNRYHIDLERGARYQPWAQIFAVFTRPWKSVSRAARSDYSRDWPPETLERLGFELLDRLLPELGENGDMIRLCRSAAEVKAAGAEGKSAALIAVEGAELIGCSSEGLDRAYDLGVRVVTLCWNYDNALCGAANGPGKGGLTPGGREYVRRCRGLGVAVDLSHASERAFWDAAEEIDGPFLASHSNSKSVWDHPRNLTDAQFREIVRLGGAAGLSFCPDFIAEEGKADIGGLLGHCERFLELGGEKAVCLGGDLDGVNSLPEGITGIESYGDLYEAMLRRNYPESLVRDIFYNNLIRVLERAL